MDSKRWHYSILFATVLAPPFPTSVFASEPAAVAADRPSAIPTGHLVSVATSIQDLQSVDPLAQSTNLQVANTAAIETISLEQLIDIALANNPSIQTLAATTQKAHGFRTQVSLPPNPRLGYEGKELGDPQNDNHTVFAEQEFVTAKKLQLNRAIQNEALRGQLQELEAQKLRVVTDIKVLYYELLSQQKQLELVNEFHKLMVFGYHLAEQRFQAAEGSRIDLLQTQVQRDEIDLRRTQTQSRIAAIWRSLAAVSGVSWLETQPLAGEFPEYDIEVDWNSIGMMISESSPEYMASLARISQARAELQRHGVQAIPNVTVQVGAAVSSPSQHRTMEVEVGAPIPVFNRNQGNIAAARAEYSRAAFDSQRIEKAIFARLATVSVDYQNSMEAVELLNNKILPSSREALELATSAYQAGEISFIQLLEARRTYFETSLQLVVARANLAVAQSRIDGQLLTGALDPTFDGSGGDSFRERTLGQR